MIGNRDYLGHGGYSEHPLSSAANVNFFWLQGVFQVAPVSQAALVDGCIILFIALTPLDVTY